jgi:probable F420-dependent oxidoreductase
VLDNDFRHPALLAKEIATLDILSGGRVELGVGAGWQIDDYRRTGLTFDQPGVRFERLRESVHVLKCLFSPGLFTYEGKYYRFHSYDARPKPVQQPLPLTIGAGGPRMLSLAAREAHVVNLVPRALPAGGMDLADTYAEAFDRKVKRIRESIGEELPSPEIATLVHQVFVTDDPAKLDEVACRAAERFSTGPEKVLESPVVLIGNTSYMVDKLRQRRERFGLTYLSVLSHNMSAFASVVAELSGRVH